MQEDIGDFQLKEEINYIPQFKHEPSCSDGSVPEYATSVINGSSLKRRRTEYENYNNDSQLHVPSYAYPAKFSSFVIPEQRSYTQSISRTFLSIRHTPYIYHTEEFKSKGCTMYAPLNDDIMINASTIDQISFESDQFFLTDGRGNYVGAKQGNAIHLWRFDCSTRRLYISRSILFLREQEFIDIRNQMEYL
ncbi:hypothetical protein CHUAL_009428 [Chamberlinius hualienensis]